MSFFLFVSVLSLEHLCLQPQHFKTECRQFVAIPLCCATPQRNHYFPLTQVVVVCKFFVVFVFVAFFYCPVATSICHLVQFCPKGNHYFPWNNLSSFARDGFVIWFVTFSFLLTRQSLLPIEESVLITVFLFDLRSDICLLFFHQPGSHDFLLKRFATGMQKQICLKMGIWGNPPWRTACYYDPWKKMTKRGSTQFFITKGFKNGPKRAKWEQC